MNISFGQCVISLGVAVGFLILPTTGSAAPQKDAWQKMFARRKGSATIGGEMSLPGHPGPFWIINDTNVPTYVVGTVTNSDVQVSYSSSLKPQADLLAELGQ